MKQEFRSDCPINFALELFGDKWSLLIVRDIVFGHRSTYNEFLDSQEKIATNILASRLKSLEQAGIIQKHTDTTRATKTKSVYVLTPMGIGLIPTFIELMLWGGQYHAVNIWGQVVIDQAKANKDKLVRDLTDAALRKRTEILQSS